MSQLNFVSKLCKLYLEAFSAFIISIFILARSLVAILTTEMESSENGLLKKMQAANMEEDMIVKIFSDLVMAAIDTVSFSVDFRAQWLKILSPFFSLLTQLFGVFIHLQATSNSKKKWEKQQLKIHLTSNHQLYAHAYVKCSDFTQSLHS